MSDDERKVATLKRLQTPRDVRDLQEAWNKIHPEDPLVVDGVFGPETKQRVEKLVAALITRS